MIKVDGEGEMKECGARMLLSYRTYPSVMHDAP
jgi:hypothetical protein